jgi:hypothetical protein
MESSFQFDFGRVRVHHDPEANQAASGFSARAFTLGRHIAFDQGEYAPGSPQGLKLLAHEMAHVVQQAQDQSPVLRRAPALKGHAKQQFGDTDASDIDKAIAASPITKYVPAKELKKLAGNVDTEPPKVFEGLYKDYGKSDEDVDQVPGFVNRAEEKPIKLRLPGVNSKGGVAVAANFEDAVHEVIHLNSQTRFQMNFGHNYNEGVTEHFTEMVLGEAGQAYRDELKLAEGLISALGAGGEDLVGKAFFKGEKEPYLTIVDAFRRDSNTHHLLDWQKASVKKPPDWKTANQLLSNALKSGSRSGSATPAPAGGTSPTKPSRPEE